MSASKTTTMTTTNVLIIGNCGVGKTHVMLNLLEGKESKVYKLGLLRWHETDTHLVIGKYNGSMYQGSDALSMAVMRDVPKFLNYLGRMAVKKVVVWEGDRFSNSKFIDMVSPEIFYIFGDGVQGREKRGSTQSERHLKAINTRVNNLSEKYDYTGFFDSNECLITLLKLK